MIDFVKLVQTRAFARQDGAILGSVWIASFALTMWSVFPPHALWGVFANILALSTPFVVARRLKAFRDEALEGSISFRRSLFYCWQTFFNATLLLTIVQFLWFKFLNTSVFISTLMESYKVILQSYNLTQAEVNTIIEALAMMKPVGWAATFMITEIIVGTVLSPLIAALMSRKRGKQQSFVNQPYNGYNSSCTSI